MNATELRLSLSRIYLHISRTFYLKRSSFFSVGSIDDYHEHNQNIVIKCIYTPSLSVPGNALQLSPRPFEEFPLFLRHCSRATNSLVILHREFLPSYRSKNLPFSTQASPFPGAECKLGRRSAIVSTL